MKNNKHEIPACAGMTEIKIIGKKIIAIASRILVVIFFLLAGAYAVRSFTEPTSGPTVTEPESTASTSDITVRLGNPNSVTTGVDTIFNWLRQIYTNIGGSPSAVSGYATDKGKISDLIGTSTPDTFNGRNVFNYLKLINDNLDFPETSSVLSSDTVKNISGVINNCTADNGGTCYISQANKSSLDADLATGNIKSGTTIFGVSGDANVVDTSSGTLSSAANLRSGSSCYSDGTSYSGTMDNCTNGGNACYASGGYWASALCSSQGSQSCWPTGSYYAATTQTLSASSQTVSQGYYAATTLSAVDADLVAGNIKSGVTIFGVTGTY